MIWLTIGLVIIGDQLTKAWFDQQGLVTLNPGVSFGWLANLPASWLTIGLLGVGVGVCFWLWRLRQVPAAIKGLMIGGIISNIIDRVVAGGVKDWLPIPGVGLTNNLADYAIGLGVLWLALVVWKGEKKASYE